MVSGEDPPLSAQQIAEIAACRHKPPVPPVPDPKRDALLAEWSGGM